MSFGTVSRMTGRGWVLEGGDIRLKRGRHSGPNRGFGAEHIWAEHSKEMAVHGLHAFEDVPHYVALIIQPNTPIYCEFGSLRGSPRIAVVRSRIGLAILEHKSLRDGDNIYSVVTAYAKTKADGIRIGAVR